MAHKIAVIGAGAKGAAIAAKAAALNHCKEADIEVVIFEKGACGNNWIGQSRGYTDGAQELCTPAERDVGFPYDDHFSTDVTEFMQAEFSWLSYAVSGREMLYADWINRGGRKPTHRDFAKYLEFVITKSKAERRLDRTVTGVSCEQKKWRVTTQQGGAADVMDEEHYDALVVTGPGPARKTFGAFTNDKLFDGESVWRKFSALRTAAASSTHPIVIVGGGGAAAAIAGWLISNGHESRGIVFIAQQATFYMRSGGFFENRVFDDEELWQLLGEKERQDFVDRITRGVVWEAVSDKLARADNIVLVPGRATGIAEVRDSGKGRHLDVTYSAATGGTRSIEACAVIDAAGFDPYWFAELLPPKLKAKKTSYFKNLAKRIGSDLRLPLPSSYPPLHTPTISQAAGPGFNSLMVLGRMADKILRPYVGE